MDSFYYVSVIDGRRFGLLAGPFRSHTEALAVVPMAKTGAQEADHRAVFYAFGTCKSDGARNPGQLNNWLGIVIDPLGYASVPESLRPAWLTELHKRITGPQTGRKHTDEYQRMLRHDRKVIEEYLFENIRNSGRGFLRTPEMRRKYPHINAQGANS